MCISDINKDCLLIVDSVDNWQVCGFIMSLIIHNYACFFGTVLYTVFRKKTPTHIFFHISMCDM